MSVENFLASTQLLSKAEKGRREREAERKALESMSTLGKEIQGSDTGQATDMGKFVGRSIELGLSKPEQLLGLLNTSPEQFAFSASMKAINDPNARILAKGALENFERINYLKSYGDAKGKLIAKMRFGSDGDGEGGKGGKLNTKKIDLNRVLPKIAQKLQEKYGIESGDITISKLPSDQLAAFNQDLENEVRSSLVTAYPEFKDKRAIGSLEYATEQIRGVISTSSMNNLTEKIVNPDGSNITKWVDFEIPFSKEIDYDIMVGNTDVTKGNQGLYQPFEMVDEEPGFIGKLFGEKKKKVKKPKGEMSYGDLPNETSATPVADTATNTDTTIDTSSEDDSAY